MQCNRRQLSKIVSEFCVCNCFIWATIFWRNYLFSSHVNHYLFWHPFNWQGFNHLLSNSICYILIVSIVFAVSYLSTLRITSSVFPFTFDLEKVITKHNVTFETNNSVIWNGSLNLQNMHCILSTEPVSILKAVNPIENNF